MITLEQLKEKARQKYYSAVTALLRGDNGFFPLVVPANRRLDGLGYSNWSASLLPLHNAQKKISGVGFSIDWRQKRVSGITQQIPERIYFETPEDFFHTIGKTAQFKCIKAAFTQITTAFPVLCDWACANPAILEAYHSVWHHIIAVCDYFTKHNPPHPYYLRELPVPVHTKFIEDHAIIIRTLLDQLLPPVAINQQANSISERYFLKHAPLFIRIRILDVKLRTVLGYDECILPMESAAQLSWQPQKVFIIENQMCYLSFPQVPNSVAIFGEGFKSRISRHLPWLKNADLFAWFDLDAAGFEMLNMLRGHYSHTQSLLMNIPTIRRYSSFAVENEQAKQKDLPCLTNEERQTYNYLVSQRLRLEQERISQDSVSAELHKL